MLKKNSVTFKKLLPLYQDIAVRPLVVIDPSIGSTSSLPGYAVYHPDGTVLDSGTISLAPSDPIQSKLWLLRKTVTTLLRGAQQGLYTDPILVVEEISDVAFRGFAARAVSPLHKATGAILSAEEVTDVIQIPPSVWRRYARSTYVKGDEEDAIEMGYVIQLLAQQVKELVENPPQPKKKGGKRRGKNK